MNDWGRAGARGRTPSAKGVMYVTKHDPTIAAIKNARVIEKYMESGSMKDIRVSNPVFNNLRQNVRRQRTRANRVRLKGERSLTISGQRKQDGHCH